MKILKTMKNESLLCFCATRFTAVAALQAYIYIYILLQIEREQAAHNNH